MPGLTVLGLSVSHDSSVSILRDEQIVVAINEERYSRRKMTCGFPVLALQEAFRISGVAPGDIDLVALAGRETREEQPVTNDFTFHDGSVAGSMRVAETLSSLPGGAALMRSDTLMRLHSGLNGWLTRGTRARFREILRGVGIRAPLVRYDHHDCHLAAAYFTSGWEEDCLLISNDGWGDGLCAKVAIGSGGQIRTLSRNTFYNSLGAYYNFATHFCGFNKIYHAGKTTGLAAYGDADRTLPYFRDRIPWVASQGRYVNRGKLFRNALREFHEYFRGVEAQDVAAGAQKHLEQVIQAMAKHFVHRTGHSRVALVGGIHANVRANQVVAELPAVEQVYVFPHMGDGGLGLGAAYLGYASRCGTKVIPRRLETLYLGSGYSDEDVEATLRQEGIAYTSPDDVNGEIARFLSRGCIVARCAGRMEYGPRALCNRSILYEATHPDVNRWLNHQLQRTEFMPFAPVIRDIDAVDFFDRYDVRTAHTAQFMTITYNVTDRCRREAPAVVHIDGTARPQIVHSGVNDDAYQILTRYKELTGNSILVNTSFNMHNEPIVCTPQDAISAYRRGNLDVLVLNRFLIVNTLSRNERIRERAAFLPKSGTDHVPALRTT